MSGIKRNLFYNFLLSLSQILVPLVSIPYVSRVLDPEGIGRVGFIDSFTYYFVVLAEAGIMVYGIRETARCRDDAETLRKLVSELMALHLRTSLISLLLYAGGVWLLWEKIGDSRLILFSFTFLLVNAWACEWYFLGRERFAYIALRSLLVRLAGLACIFLLIHQPDDYYFYYAIIAGSAVVTGIWNLGVLFREIPVSLRNAGWKRHLSKIWVTYLISLLYSIPLYLDHVILRLAATASAVGFYTFSVRLLRVSTILISDSFLVFFPRIASLHAADDNNAVQLRLSQNFRLIMLLAIPMGVGIFLLATDLTTVIFGPSFSSISRNLQILAFYPVLRSYSLFLSNPVLIGHQQERLFLRNLVIGTIVFFLLALYGGYRFADWGICLALVVSDLFLILLNYFSIRKRLPALRIMEPRIMIQALVAALFFVPAVMVVDAVVDQAVLRLLLVIPVCMVLYLLVMIFVFRNRDLSGLIQLLYATARSSLLNRKKDN